MNTLDYIADKAGCTVAEAQMIADMAEMIAMEQGDEEFDVLDWLHNRGYDWCRLLEAAKGDVGALVEVRTEAGLPIFV